MEHDPYKTWDLVIKGLALLGAIVGAFWAYHTYTDTKEKEFYSVFWNQKLSLYLETSSAASTMGTTQSVEEFNKARTRYRELFFGRLSLVEGPSVKQAMERFAPLVPTAEVAASSLPLVSLQQPSYQLTVALKEELGRAWKEPFAEL